MTKPINAGTSLAGPIVDQTPKGPANTPVDQRLKVSVPVTPQPYSGLAITDPYQFTGKTGAK